MKRPRVSSMGTGKFDFTKHTSRRIVVDYNQLLEKVYTDGHSYITYQKQEPKKEKNLVFLTPQVNIFGRLAHRKIVSVGVSWIRSIPVQIWQNIVEKVPEVTDLPPAETWIATMILHDYPGVMCARLQRTNVVSIMLLCLASRVFHFWNQRVNCNFRIIGGNNPLEYEFQEQFVPPIRPLAIIICSTNEEARCMGSHCAVLLKNTRMTWEIVTEELVNNNNGCLSHHIVMGSPRNLRDYLRKFKRLLLLVITRCSVYRGGSEEEQILAEIREYMREKQANSFSTFAFYKTACEVSPLIESFLPADYSLVTVPSNLSVSPPGIKLCLCAQTDVSAWQDISTCQKLAWLHGILVKTSNRSNKSTLILCRTPELAIFLSTYCNYKYRRQFPLITSESDEVGIERAKNLFHSRETDCMVMDYDSLTHLEPGHIANVVMYDFPEQRLFSRKMNTICKLSAKIAEAGCRNVYMIVDSEMDCDAIIPIHKFLSAIGEDIPETFHTMYVSKLE